MASKVKVYGKAQNRTALGIMHAYHIMFPKATMADFVKAFPKELNPDSGWADTFKKLEEAQAEDNKSFWFTEPDEIIKLQDGTKVSVVKMWTKSSFENLVNHAKQYDIEVAEFEKGQRGEKGGFRLEYLNGYIPPKQEKSKAWLWILIAAVIVILGLLAWMLFGKKPAPEVQVVEKVVEVEKIVEVHDTLYIQQLAEIEKNFNAAEFAQGKAKLSEDAKFVLHDLGKLMQNNPELRLRIAGHTSAEGNAAVNQKLSEARAQAAVTFLVEHEGIDAARLEAAGLGSSQLKNIENPKAPENRRTEFEILN